MSACSMGDTFFDKLCFIMNSNIVLCVSFRVKDKGQVWRLIIDYTYIYGTSGIDN
jgi:hypothetical protein